jgi:hypothetical protein
MCGPPFYSSRFGIWQLNLISRLPFPKISLMLITFDSDTSAIGEQEQKLLCNRSALLTSSGFNGNLRFLSFFSKPESFRRHTFVGAWAVGACFIESLTDEV